MGEVPRELYTSLHTHGEVEPGVLNPACECFHTTSGVQRLAQPKGLGKPFKTTTCKMKPLMTKHCGCCG